MIFIIEFSDEAKLDLWEARNYYSKLSDELLGRFDDSFVNTIERLESNPENFQKRYKNIKIAFTKTFPYGIHYIIEKQIVYIQRVLHQKQFYK